MFDPKITAARIKHARKCRKMTQIDVSAATDIARSHISRIERAEKNASIDALSRLAEFFDVPLIYFIDAEFSVPIPKQMQAFLNQPRALKILEIFGRLSKDEQLLAMRMMRGLSDADPAAEESA